MIIKISVISYTLPFYRKIPSINTTMYHIPLMWFILLLTFIIYLYIYMPLSFTRRNEQSRFTIPVSMYWFIHTYTPWQNTHSKISGRRNDHDINQAYKQFIYNYFFLTLSLKCQYILWESNKSKKEHDLDLRNSQKFPF